MDQAKVAVAVKSEAASAKPSTNIDDEKKVDAIKDNQMEMVSTCVNILRAVVGVFVTVGPTVNFFPFMPFKRGYLLQIKNPHGYSRTFVPRQLA